MSSIIMERLNKDRQALEQAEQKVEQLPAIRPSETEIQKSDEIVRKVSEMFSNRIATEGITDSVKNTITMQVEKEVGLIEGDYEMRSRIRRLVLSSMFGLGPLEPYLKQSSGVTDIIVQRYNSICVEDKTGMHRVEAEFNSEEHLRNVIQRIVQQVGRQINLSCPMVDAKLSDGSRVHATIPPISPDGATLTIRRFNNEKLDPDDYLRLGTLDKRMLEFLKLGVVARLNIMVSGGTGSGKTTLLNMLSSFIPEREIIITVEDNCELQLRQPNVRRLEARVGSGEMVSIDIQQLVKQTLRMRPDRIIVGEVRDGAVVDMFSAMSTGHEGSMSTVHSDSPEALVGSRLPTLFSQYKGGNFTEETQTYMTAEALHLIVQISREPNMTRRITHITAIDGLDPETHRIRLVDLFRFDREHDRFSIAGRPPQALMERFAKNRVAVPDWIFDTSSEQPIP